MDNVNFKIGKNNIDPVLNLKNKHNKGKRSNKILRF